MGCDYHTGSSLVPFLPQETTIAKAKSGNEDVDYLLTIWLKIMPSKYKTLDGN